MPASVAAADAEVAETAVGDEVDFLFVGACCSCQLTVVCMLMPTSPVVLDQRLVSSMWMCVIHGQGEFLNMCMTVRGESVSALIDKLGQPNASTHAVHNA